MIVLGIETSCDETAAALVTDQRDILAHVVPSQILQHQRYGGVVPEIASRAHLDVIQAVVEETFAKASLTLADIDGIAVTGGPGLIGGLIVGVSFAKALAAAAQKPFIAVNHLEGHGLTARLTDNVPFPYLLLLISGGHCQFLLAQGVGQYRLLGTTLDDALGETFDKVGRLLNLPYPGGPEIEKQAKEGDPFRFSFPKPFVGREGCDFSFSGLKTALSRHITQFPGDVADTCASFQETVAQILEDRLRRALCMSPDVHHLVIAGGVAANRFLFERLKKEAHTQKFTTIAPPPALCTDNGAMIAWAGLERLQLGKVSALDFAPRPRWPLEALREE